MNQVQAFTEDLFAKYREFTTSDEAKTNVKYLNEEQKSLVDRALNLHFLNPKFKMKHFVTNGQLTPYSTIRQLLLELKVMEEATETFVADYKEKLVEVEHTVAYHQPAKTEEIKVNKIKSVKDMVNFLVSKVDKRKNKIVYMSKTEESDIEITAINLGIASRNSVLGVS